MTANLPARIDDLPKSMVDVAETLGIQVALKLIEAFGGIEVKFPRKPFADDHPIVLALGEKDAHALWHFMGCSRIYVPHGRIKSVRASVLELQETGMSREEIARELRISQRHVRRVANTSQILIPNQPDLFD